MIHALKHTQAGRQAAVGPIIQHVRTAVVAAVSTVMEGEKKGGKKRDLVPFISDERERERVTDHFHTKSKREAEEARPGQMKDTLIAFVDPPPPPTLTHTITTTAKLGIYI